MPWIPGADKRLNYRKARKFLIKYRLIGGTGSQDSTQRVGEVLNFSKTGIYLVAKRKLPVGTILEFTIPENLFGGSAKTVRGVVRRTDLDTPRGTPTGLIFVKASAAGSSPSTAKQKPAAKERRQPRKPKHFIVNFRCVSPSMFKEIDHRGGRLMNISEGGMELWARCTYPLGSNLEVDIPKNPLGNPRQVLAKLVWTERTEKKGWHRLGLSIVKSSVPRSKP